MRESEVLPHVMQRKRYPETEITVSSKVTPREHA